MKDRIADHISGKLGVPDMVELLAERVQAGYDRIIGTGATDITALERLRV